MERNFWIAYCLDVVHRLILKDNESKKGKKKHGVSWICFFHIVSLNTKSTSIQFYPVSEANLNFWVKVRKS